MDKSEEIIEAGPSSDINQYLPEGWVFLHTEYENALPVEHIHRVYRSGLSVYVTFRHRDGYWEEPFGTYEEASAFFRALMRRIQIALGEKG